MDASREVIKKRKPGSQDGHSDLDFIDLGDQVDDVNSVLDLIDRALNTDAASKERERLQRERQKETQRGCGCFSGQ
jgi:hypothetical protein